MQNRGMTLSQAQSYKKAISFRHTIKKRFITFHDGSLLGRFLPEGS